MKTGIIWLIFFAFVVTIFQIVLAGVVPAAAPQLSLGYFIVMSNFVSYKALMWTALFSGVLLDLYGPRANFGVHLGVILLAVMICKLVIRLEDQPQKLLFSLVATVAFSILLELVGLAILIQHGISIPTTAVLMRAMVEIIYNSVSVGIMYGIFESVQSYRQTKHRFSLLRGKA